MKKNRETERQTDRQTDRGTVAHAPLLTLASQAQMFSTTARGDMTRAAQEKERSSSERRTDWLCGAVGVWVLGFVWVSDGGAGEGLFVVQCVCVDPSIHPSTDHPSIQPTNQPIHPSINQAPIANVPWGRAGACRP